MMFPCLFLLILNQNLSFSLRIFDKPRTSLSNQSKEVQSTGFYGNPLVPMSVLANNKKTLAKGINRKGLTFSLEETIGAQIAINELKEMKLIEAFYEMQMKEMRSRMDAEKSNVIDVKNILRTNGMQQISNVNGFVDWSGANGHMVGWRGK